MRRLFHFVFLIYFSLVLFFTCQQLNANVSAEGSTDKSSGCDKNGATKNNGKGQTDDGSNKKDCDCKCKDNQKTDPANCKEKDDKKKEDDCKNKGPDNNCIRLDIPFGSSINEPTIPNGYLLIYKKRPSLSVYSPQGLFYAHNLATGILFDQTTNLGGGVREVTLYDNKGSRVKYRFDSGSGLGYPVDENKSSTLRLRMTDASGNTITNNPIYYELLSDFGSMIKYSASSTDLLNYKKAVSIRTANGRVLEKSSPGIRIEPIYDEVNNIRQVWSGADGLADMVITGASSYEIRLYTPENVGSKGQDGLYALASGATPHTVWKIEKPSGYTGIDKVQITKTVNATDYVSLFEYSNAGDEWTLTKGGGLLKNYKSITWDSNKTNSIVTETVSNTSGNISYKKQTYKHIYGFGEAVSQVINDPEGAALKTEYTYYEDSGDAVRFGLMKSVKNSNGPYTNYEYDSQGRVSRTEEPFANLSAGSAKNTYYYYTPHDSADTLVLNDQRPRTEEVKINGITVSKTFYVFKTVSGEPVFIEEKCASPSASYGASSNLRTTTVSYSASDAVQAGRVKYIDFPDGRRDTYTYQYGSYSSNADPSASSFTPGTGNAMRRTITHGTASAPDGIANKSTKETNVTDDFGNEVLTETYAYTGSAFNRVAWNVSTYDSEHHVLHSYFSNNTETGATWNCCDKASETLSDGTQYTYAYDLLQRVSSKTKIGAGGAPNIVTSYTYDTAGRVLSTTVTAGGLSRSSSTEYDWTGRIKKTTDEAGLETTYAYQNGGQITTATFPGGATQITENAADGKPLRVTGTAVVNMYYEHGVNSDGTVWQKEYVSAPNSPRWTKKTFDPLNRLVKEESPAFSGSTPLLKQYVYNTKGQLAKVSQTGNADVLYSYDDLGNLFRSCLDVNANGAIDLASMDRINETETTFTTESSAIWQQTVNKVYGTDNSATPTATGTSKKKLTALASGTSSETRNTDINGNETINTVTVDRTNKTVTQTVNAPDSSVDAVTTVVNGLVTSERSSTNLTYTYSYDALGRRTGVTDPRTGTSVISYDSNGRTAYTEDAASNRETYAYEAATGRLSSVTNALSKAKAYTYNTRGQILTVRGDADYPMDYVYDSYGTMTQLKTYRDSLTTPDITTWAYQEATGLLQTKTYADNKSVSYTYTVNGRILTRTWSRLFNSNALVTTYSYNSNTGDILGMTYSDNVTPNVAATYNRLGQIATITDAVGSRTFSYNSVFGLTSEAITGIYNKTLNRSYATTGVIGRYSGMNIGTEYSLAYGYDTYGRLNSLTNGSDTFSYSYLSNSNLINSISYPNTISVTNSYESNRDLLTSVENKYGTTTISKYDYVNNAIANRTSMAKSGTAFPQADTISYGYNDKSEVTSATAQNDTNYVYNYSFDNIGNRISATESGTSKAYTSNLLNQYTAITNPTTAPTYDDDGNMLNDGTWSLSWDAENRLTKAERGTDKIEFMYDYQSRRIDKKVYSGTTLTSHKRFIYDGYLKIEELDGLNNNDVTKKRIWNGDKLISEIRGAATYYAMGDANKNITEYLDASGNIKAHYEYSPFGKITAKTGDMQDSFDYRFSSEYFDTETGFVYYIRRYYSPDLGRWLSRDPIEEWGGINIYRFCLNNSNNYFDTLGREPKTIQVRIYRDDSVKKISQKTKDKIKAQVDRLKKTLSACCKYYKIGCDTQISTQYVDKDIPVPYTDSNSVYDTSEDKDPYHKTPQELNDEAVTNEITKSQKDNEISVLLTLYPVTGAANIGAFADTNKIVFPMNNLDGNDILAHETGHFVGYDCGDIDKGTHSSNKKNIMYPTTNKNESDKKPDECYCKKLAGKAK